MKRNMSKVALLAMFALLGACSTSGEDENKGKTTPTKPTDAEIKAELITALEANIATNTSATSIKTFTKKYYSILKDVSGSKAIYAVYFDKAEPTKRVEMQVQKKSDGTIKFDNVEDTKALTMSTPTAAFTASGTTLFYYKDADNDGDTSAFADLPTALNLEDLSTVKLYIKTGTDAANPFYIILTDDKLTVVDTFKYNITGTKLTLKAANKTELPATIQVLNTYTAPKK